jgi:hypothetical protein
MKLPRLFASSFATAALALFAAGSTFLAPLPAYAQNESQPAQPAQPPQPAQPAQPSSEPQTALVFEGKEGPGKGKHVVLLAGDEEYRSEESLPMLAKILSQRHGFKCTVLFSVDPDGTVNPDNGSSLSHPEALDTADVIIMGLRFRNWPDAAMEKFDNAYRRGVPFIALRTSTHAFNIPKDSKWAKYSYNFAGPDWPKGFGRQVLGETWVAHHGDHKKEATRGVIEDSAESDPLLRGAKDLFGPTDVYTANPSSDVKILVRGQVLAGMKPNDPAVKGPKNEPMQPIVWTRTAKNESGNQNKVLTTTMGSANDLLNESLRRLVVNGVYWGAGLDIPK